MSQRHESSQLVSTCSFISFVEYEYVLMYMYIIFDMCPQSGPELCRTKEPSFEIRQRRDVGKSHEVAGDDTQ